ncbi:hypothetical protein B0H16DRAFT_1539102 [Mycena metata]|uniref:BAG domain-containing protein n=1 Tax=Mycena metata TaxID=1033252 RepID=A0AAD7J3K3_9AGAR|nr:hypothetical protein B0H16DRAFT_1539102 [Mycena metata]
MFSFYPRPQSYYSPSPYQTYHQPSPYARALAQQQQQQRARAIAQETERQRAARSRYFPEGYDYQPESDEEDYYLTPRQRAFIEAKRRQEALEQRRQAAARMAHENAMEQARNPEKESTPPQSPLRRSASPSATRTPTPPPVVSPPSPSPELLEEAATKIQTKYRIHRSLRAISELASQFESLKSTFVNPTTIDYQAGDGTIVSVPVPATPTSAPAESAKLAFTPTNVPLHTYSELLSRLLVALDGVESRGDRGLRERRRSVVRAVEAEAARVEALWRSVWASHLEQEQQQRVNEEEEEVCAMVVDEAVAPLPELATPESESDVEPELPTPPATPAAAPELVLSPEPAQDDAVIIEMPEEDEKVSGDDFVLV